MSILPSSVYWPTIVSAYQQHQPLPDVASSPLLLGLSAAQGAGKTTWCRQLQSLWAGQGVSVEVVSLDDYYLERHQRQQLAQQIHPLCLQRGVPGSHDVSALQQDILAFLAGAPVSWRRFDKATETARRAAPSRASVLLFEGWCLGFPPQLAEQLVVPQNRLEAERDAEGLWRQWVNQQLTDCYQPLWSLCHELLWFKAPDWQTICHWRLQQEQQLWRQGAGQSVTELAEFMLHFERLTQFSFQVMSERADCWLAQDANRGWGQLTCRSDPPC